VQDRVKRTGDGSHGLYKANKKLEDEGGQPKQFWGWGDVVDMTEEDYKSIQIYQPSRNSTG